MKVSFHHFSRVILVALITTALLLLAWQLWLWPKPPVVKLPGGNDRFGLCFISSADALADETRYAGALATGARWDRWPLYWHWVDQGGYVGPHDGGRHDYDTLVAQELAHGLTPIAVLVGTPARWARTTAPDSLLPARDNSAALPPATLFEPIFADGADEFSPGRAINPANTWAKFVFDTVERYRPGGRLAREKGWPAGGAAGLRYWEIWNEPDYDLFWRGTVADYYRLLEVAYQSIKAADPEATVILGGLAFYEKPDWFSNLLKQSGGDPGRAYFDIFSFHHYLSIYNSERMLAQVRAVLDAYHLAGIPIWVTESGVSVWDDYPATAYGVAPTEPFRATRAEQAAYIIENAALAFYAGVERYYHFMLHDDCGDSPSSAYGLRQNFSPHPCNPAGGKLRPAYAAYQLAAQQFQEVIPLWREKQYEQDRVAFYRPGDQTRLVALWATQGLTVTATISATGETAQLYWVEFSPAVSGTTGLSRSLVLTPAAGVYNLLLPPATNQNTALPGDTAYPIGGRPYLLVERDTRPPEATVQALPATSPPDFRVRWQGEDRGSGIAGYDVWLSQDGGPLRLWLVDTPATEATYAGQVDHAYGFAVQARDRAGNQMPAPAQSQATTRVGAGLPVAGVVLGPDGQPVAGAAITIQGVNSQSDLVTGGDGAWPAVSAPAGEYLFKASAQGYDTWPTPRRLVISVPTTITLTLAPAPNYIAAGDFEGNQVWNVWDWPNGQVSLSIDAFDGQAGLRLGDGAGQAMTCPAGGQLGQLWTVQQRVGIPATPAPVLSFMVKISTPQVAPHLAWLEVVVVAAGRPLALIPAGELWQATDWVMVSRGLSVWSGQEVELQFQVVRCAEQPFSVTLDRVSVGEAAH